jgi:hypothetical protein
MRVLSGQSGSDRVQFAPASLGTCLPRSSGSASPASSSAPYHHADVAIHLVGRDDQTTPAFLDFAADCRVEASQRHLEALDYHCHSSSSQEA